MMAIRSEAVYFIPQVLTVRSQVQTSENDVLPYAIAGLLVMRSLNLEGRAGYQTLGISIILSYMDGEASTFGGNM